jgi:hypothetical protein
MNVFSSLQYFFDGLGIYYWIQIPLLVASVYLMTDRTVFVMRRWNIFVRVYDLWRVCNWNENKTKAYLAAGYPIFLDMLCMIFIIATTVVGALGSFHGIMSAIKSLIATLSVPLNMAGGDLSYMTPTLKEIYMAPATSWIGSVNFLLLMPVQVVTSLAVYVIGLVNLATENKLEVVNNG